MHFLDQRGPTLYRPSKVKFLLSSADIPQRRSGKNQRAAPTLGIVMNRSQQEEENKPDSDATGPTAAPCC
jgi:hypothetical protein